MKTMVSTTLLLITMVWLGAGCATAPPTQDASSGDDLHSWVVNNDREQEAHQYDDLWNLIGWVAQFWPRSP